MKYFHGHAKELEDLGKIHWSELRIYTSDVLERAVKEGVISEITTERVKLYGALNKSEGNFISPPSGSEDGWTPAESIDGVQRDPADIQVDIDRVRQRNEWIVSLDPIYDLTEAHNALDSFERKNNLKPYWQEMEDLKRDIESHFEEQEYTQLEDFLKEIQRGIENLSPEELVQYLKENPDFEKMRLELEKRIEDLKEALEQDPQLDIERNK